MTTSSKFTAAVRILLGIVFFVFGLNGFLGFIPTPESSGDAGHFMGGLAASGYVFPLLKGLEIMAGVALLSNRLVPLALVVLAPVVVHIALFHVFLAPAGLPIAMVVLGAEVYLAWRYRDHFRGVLALQALPSGSAQAQPSLSPATVLNH